MLSVYQLPRINDQFAFEKAVKNVIDNKNYAFNIDGLAGWQIQIVINTALPKEAVRSLTFCSRNSGTLYAIGMSFKYGKLWFIDTEKKSELTEEIDGLNFITVSRV